MARVEVLIVGAGPTGLVLALWLAQQGICARIVDKTAGPGTTSRALAVQARTLELYSQLGLADEVVAAGMRNPGFNLWVGGERKAHLSFARAGAHLTPYSFLLVYPQDQHEALLVRRLEQMGVPVERNTELLDFEDKGDHVTARLRMADGAEERCEATFLAGCDGARSPVRHQLGASFEGGTYEHIFYVADVKISGPAANGEVNISLDQSDFVAILSYSSDGHARLIGTVREDRAGQAEQLTFEDVSQRAIARLRLTIDEVKWFSTYHVHHRVTNRYRQGRVFLLGDAAHIHSPAGGQGMNTGIGDAINLAWKLKAVLRGEAGDSLLDSYEPERIAFAKKLVETTDRVFTFVTAEGSFADFVRMHVAPLFATAVDHIDAVKEFMFRVLSQTMVSYHDSPLSEGTAGHIKGGDRLPWVRVDGSDNYEPLAAIAWQVHVYGQASSDLRAWCEARGMALHEFAWHEAHDQAGLARDAAYLLRPDTYVALAEPGGSAQALNRYFSERGFTKFASVDVDRR
ncbi:FAD-dependent monooxygenase [Massilia solisilvae]|uniref:FAD-dependent monooxygenase n=1 Tax=Massilia solisilvae TaxID=1811225 RepID=A0ABT2BIP6_9BURK|nr:FAD-dependent monooxygenase [Massilia solisilvae]MCS0608387.1 FAD-dependent monooxygenase [Massilia solisilvae]